jgi:glycosyltransferase involved in cell wall biosynthesis
MKILIAYGSKGKFFHMNEFSDALTKFGVECKLVKDSEYSRGFPSKNVKDWFFGNRKFKNLLNEFKPDAIFVDRQTHFGINAIKARIPLFVLLRGHYWSEIDYAKQTLYKGPIVRTLLWFRNRLTEKCFSGSAMIFPICSYLEKVVKEHHPKVPTKVFFEGISALHWYPVNGMRLNHPCVGLLQDANWWGKTKEMLVLKKVLEKMPEVTFYWAGDGPYRQQILSELEKYKNFKWLGRLEYPDKVREYLSEIDVYALITGMDLAPLTLKEAQLMEKPVIGTDVGGVGEMMADNQTGFLVKEGNYEDLIEKLALLITNKELADKMGKEGKKFVVKTFSWEIIAKRFLDAIEPHIEHK